VTCGTSALQDLLLPPSLRDWLPESHLAYFVSDLIDQLDLNAIEGYYEQEERGPASTKQSGKFPGKGTTARDQSAKTTIKAERAALQRGG
jgi:hypothetical protein